MLRSREILKATAALRLAIDESDYILSTGFGAANFFAALSKGTDAVVSRCHGGHGATFLAKKV